MIRRDVDEPSVLSTEVGRFYIGVGATVLVDETRHRITEVGPDGEIREYAFTNWSLLTVTEREENDRQSCGGRGPAEYHAIEKARRG